MLSLVRKPVRFGWSLLLPTILIPLLGTAQKQELQINGGGSRSSSRRESRLVSV